MEKRELALRFGLPIRERIEESSSFRRETLECIPYAFAKKHQLLLLEERQEEVVIAVADPLCVEPLDEVAALLKKRVRVEYCDAEILLDAMDRFYHQHREGALRLLHEKGDTEKKDISREEEFDLLEDENTPLVQLLNHIFSEALRRGASDIHIEPFSDELLIRYRIDGVLVTQHRSTEGLHHALMSRIKVMAKLDLAERRLPQDGRMKLRLASREVDFRVSILPVVDGERAVLRILDQKDLSLSLDRLGMGEEEKKTFRRWLQQSEGMILVTGPTGSGKTTTLYSALKELDGSALNITTIEDPVEYKLPGIAQVAVRPAIGLSFAKGLRHILRQDPDIIMVGEIRDTETASIAVHAALTGHLVLTTIHTNDAPSALTRLTDMGIEPYLLTSSILGVLSQRLIRKVCTACGGEGCSQCFTSGYHQRRAIFEVMSLTTSLRQQALKSCDAEELRAIALAEGMLPLWKVGQDLVEKGETTLTEVMRVTRNWQL